MFKLSAIGTFLLDIIQVIFFAVAIFLFVYLLILQPHKIKGNSMDPTFKNGEFLLTDKVTYRFGEPKRGDVVVFKAPPDKVLVQTGKVFVNDQLINEKAYLDQSVYTQGGNFANDGEMIVVTQNEYFVMGDNRNHSFDSRNFGTIATEKITGRAWVVYWPPQKAGVVPEVNYGF